MSSSPGSQPSRALICVDGVGGLCLCSSSQSFLVASTSGDLRSLLPSPPAPPPPTAKLCGRRGGGAGRESDIAFPASSRVRGWPSQGTEVAQDPCPFLPSVLSSGQASGCGVDLGESVFFLITVGRSPEPERSMGGSRHVGTEATMPQCPAEDSS